MKLHQYKHLFWITMSLGFLLWMRAGAIGQEQTDREIRGFVTDETGNPVTGALVGVLDEKLADLRESKTDADGRFRVSELEREATYRIVVTKYGYQQASLDGVKPSSRELPVRLKPDEKSSISTPGPPKDGEPPPAHSKDGSRPGEEEPFSLSVAVREILLNVSVEDTSGRPVADLQKEDFSVFEDGVLQQIKYFGHENVPVSAILLVDTSSSMQGSPMVEAKVAALAFLGECRPSDAVSLVAFNDKVEVIRPFTEDMLQVRTGVHSLTPQGGTALYDALVRSADLMSSAPHPRHAIVLLSDGKDEDSFLKFAEVDRRIQASDVVLFSIGEYADLDRKLFIDGKKYYKPPEYDVNLNPVWVLRYFADLSGGRAFFPKLGDPLEPFFAQIAKELHQQYVITYQPAATLEQGNFHSIEVKVTSSKAAMAVRVRTRKGYLSEPDKQPSSPER